MYKTIAILALIVLTGAAFGFTITLTGDYYVPGLGDIDSGRTITVDRLPIDTTFYSITTYADGEDFVINSETFILADSTWDTVTVNYIHAKRLDITADNEVRVYINDTSGVNPVYMQDSETLSIENLIQEIARLIIWAPESSEVSINVFGLDKIEVK